MQCGDKMTNILGNCASTQYNCFAFNQEFTDWAQ